MTNEEKSFTLRVDENEDQVVEVSLDYQRRFKLDVKYSDLVDKLNEVFEKVQLNTDKKIEKVYILNLLKSPSGTSQVEGYERRRSEWL